MAVACGVLLAACNAAFDLTPTTPWDGGADFDKDGVEDARDNCPTVGNADQLNGDGDAFGDACDTCPLVASASVHDEDGDLFGDDCDLCPGIPDFQDDSDNDGVGDLCDPLPMSPQTPNHRVAFESFETLPASWASATVAWSADQDAVSPIGDVTSMDRGFLNNAISINKPYTVVIGYQSTMRWGAGDRAGIVARRSAQDMVGCELHCDPSQCNSSLLGPTFNIAETPAVPRPFARIGMKVLAANQLDCIFENAPGLGFSSPPADPVSFAITGSKQIHITYFEVIQ